MLAGRQLGLAWCCRPIMEEVSFKARRVVGSVLDPKEPKRAHDAVCAPG